MPDIFNILGPIMVGPSSSHTAGAARIGKMARILLGEPVREAELLLHGSFAETGRGHGTDRALISGLLGMNPDDLRIPFAFDEAEKAGLKYRFGQIELRNANPNSVVLKLTGETGKKLEMQASSIGGGAIMVNELDGISVEFDGHYNTLVINHLDEFGTIAEVTRLLSNYRVNIAHMKLSRHKKGGEALVVIETDQSVEDRLVEWISQFPGVQRVTYYDKREEERDRA